jgi:hypothetical protein
MISAVVLTPPRAPRVRFRFSGVARGRSLDLRPAGCLLVLDIVWYSPTAVGSGIIMLAPMARPPRARPPRGELLKLLNWLLFDGLLAARGRLTLGVAHVP